MPSNNHTQRHPVIYHRPLSTVCRPPTHPCQPYQSFRVTGRGGRAAPTACGVATSGIANCAPQLPEGLPLVRRAYAQGERSASIQASQPTPPSETSPWETREALSVEDLQPSLQPPMASSHFGGLPGSDPSSADATGAAGLDLNVLKSLSDRRATRSE